MAKVSRLMTFTFLIRCCIAWSWSRQSPDPSAKHDTQGFSSQMHGSFCVSCIIVYITLYSLAELSHEEIDLISKHTGIGAFDGYMRKNDCFQDAARHAQSRCEVSHMSEDERIQGFSSSCARFETFLIFLVAIRLTLCELATARHHTPPLECSPFNNNVGSHIPHHAVGDCVDALSRSAQFWSSYSGYLREIREAGSFLGCSANSWDQPSCASRFVDGWKSTLQRISIET